MYISQNLAKKKSNTIKFLQLKKTDSLDIGNIDWLLNLHAFSVDFDSPYPKNLIKKSLEHIVNHQYFSIIVPESAKEVLS